MDLNFDAETEAFRAEVRQFLNDNRDKFPTHSYDIAEGFEQHRRWDKVLFDAGLSVIAWPKKYGGRDATLLQWVVYEEEYFRAGAPGRASANGTSMLAPTLFAHGTQEQLDRVLPKMASGERSGRRPGASRSPAATWRRCVRRPPRSTAAGSSTARRSGVLGRRSASAASGCSAPTRKRSATTA